MQNTKDRIDSLVFADGNVSSLDDKQVESLAVQTINANQSPDVTNVVVDKRVLAILVASYMEHEGSK